MVIFDIVRIIEICIFLIVILGLGIFYIIINIKYWIEDIKSKKNNEKNLEKKKGDKS